MIRAITVMSSALAMLAGVICFFPETPAHAVSSPLTPREERGRHIYFEGKSLAGRAITAYFGRELIEVPGESATCASCHGYDGLGRPESGVIPTNITWKQLVKSYGHIHPDGLEHGPFTEESLKSYMRDGVYPGGKQGDPAMPVYDISEDDLDDLIGYLKRLGTYLDPGLSESAIRVGTLLAEGSAAEMGEAMEKTVLAYFAEINEKGGIYGRKIELVADRTPSGGASAAHFQRFIAEKQPFAMVTPHTPGSDRELSLAATNHKIPVVGPFTLFPLGSLSLNEYIFYIYPGLREQARALVEFAAGNVNLDDPRIAVLHPAREELADTVAAVEDSCKGKGWHRVVKIGYRPAEFDAAAMARRLKREIADLVIFLGSEAEAMALLKETASFARIPWFFMPGVLMGSGVFDIPAVFGERIFLAYPSLPSDRKAWGSAELTGLLNRHGLPLSHPVAQISAYTAARILVEGLRLAGRELSRELLITSLERLYQFDTGLTPPITYGRNRRVGSLGAYIVTVDPRRAGKKEFVSPRGWITLD